MLLLHICWSCNLYTIRTDSQSWRTCKCCVTYLLTGETETHYRAFSWQAEQCDTILQAYVNLLIQEKHIDLVANYVDHLPHQTQIELYAKFLEGIYTDMFAAFDSIYMDMFAAFDSMYLYGYVCSIW